LDNLNCKNSTVKKEQNIFKNEKKCQKNLKSQQIEKNTKNLIKFKQNGNNTISNTLNNQNLKNFRNKNLNFENFEESLNLLTEYDNDEYDYENEDFFRKSFCENNSITHPDSHSILSYSTDIKINEEPDNSVIKLSCFRPVNENNIFNEYSASCGQNNSPNHYNFNSSTDEACEFNDVNDNLDFYPYPSSEIMSFNNLDEEKDPLETERLLYELFRVSNNKLII
jgi:hypothetical protein